MKISKLCRILTVLLSILILVQTNHTLAFAEEVVPIAEGTPEESVETPSGAPLLTAKSAILMEATTGKILFTKNAEEALPPASVTKIMTLLLVMEAIDTGKIKMSDLVSVSAHAASMGGSQVYLKEGERMTVEDLLKSVVIASANDAAVALAEYISGSVDSFVDKMNRRAEQLGLKNTRFENPTGLDDTATSHLTSAHDIALMSQALIRHNTILQYSSIWMDTIRDGAFGLTNTNRLVRFYRGCTGLKTGSTDKAGFCVSVTAERDDLSLICVIMGAETSDIRNTEATRLLDWGFSEYALYVAEPKELPPIRVQGGTVDSCRVISSRFSCVVKKSDLNEIKSAAEYPAFLTAPIERGAPIGRIVYKLGDRELGWGEISALDSIDRINFFEIFKRIAAKFLLI